MRRIRTSLIAGGSALLLALSLGACGGTDDSAGSEATSTEQPVVEEEVVDLGTDAAVEPDLINPGWLYGDNTSDLWYANGDEGAEALYFTNAGNDAGIDVTFVDTDGSEDSVWYLEVADGHLVTQADAGDKRAVDFTFQDNFNCYDAITDTHYVRGDRTQEKYNELLSGKVFVGDPEDPDDFMVTFGEDGMVTQSMDDAAIEGTWEVQTPNVVVAHYERWDTEYRWDPKASEVTELDDGGSIPLVEYSGQ